MLGRLYLLETRLLHDQFEKFATACELHHQVEILLGLDNFIDLDNVGVVKFFQNFDFTTYPFDIFLILYLRFFKHFHSNFLSCEDVSAESDFAESALTQSFAENVVAYRGLLWFLTGGGLHAVWLLVF